MIKFKRWRYVLIISPGSVIYKEYSLNEIMKTEIRSIADEIQSPSIAARDWVFQVIRTAIMRGVLPCNMPLRQEEISDALNVSHIPVREAFRQLEAYGLIKIYPNRGAVVSSLTKKELIDMCDVLFILEKAALNEAFDNITDEQLEFISTAARKIDKSDEWHFASSNISLHLAWCIPSKNGTMLSFIEQIRANADRFLRHSQSSLLQSADIMKEHIEITDAFVNRDRTALNEAFKKHFERERELMLDSKFLS